MYNLLSQKSIFYEVDQSLSHNLRWSMVFCISILRHFESWWYLATEIVSPVKQELLIAELLLPVVRPGVLKYSVWTRRVDNNYTATLAALLLLPRKYIYTLGLFHSMYDIMHNHAPTHQIRVHKGNLISTGMHSIYINIAQLRCMLKYVSYGKGYIFFDLYNTLTKTKPKSNCEYLRILYVAHFLLISSKGLRWNITYVT